MQKFSAWFPFQAYNVKQAQSKGTYFVYTYSITLVQTMSIVHGAVLLKITLIFIFISLKEFHWRWVKLKTSFVTYSHLWKWFLPDSWSGMKPAQNGSGVKGYSKTGQQHLYL